MTTPTLDRELEELELLVAQVDEQEAGVLNQLLDNAEQLGPSRHFELTQELIHTLRHRQLGIKSTLASDRLAKLESVISATQYRELLHHLSGERLRELQVSGDTCGECDAYAGAHDVCGDCGEFLHVDTWYQCLTTSVVTGHTMKGHERVMHSNAKGAPDTIFYYNPRTKEVYMPGHDTRHTSPESRGYEKHAIGIREYGLKSKFYKFLDRLAVDRRERRLKQTDDTFAPIFKENRSNLLRKLQTEFGRDALREAIRLTESKDEKYEQYSPNSHIEGWEFDEANIRDGHSNDPNPSLDKFQPKHAEVSARIRREKELARMTPRDIREKQEAEALR